MGSQRITIFIAPRARYSAPGPPGTERGKKIPLENSFPEYACHRFSLLSLQGEFSYGILLWFSYDYLIEFLEECTRMQESARDGPRMHPGGAQGTHSNAVCDIWRRDLGGREGGP